MTRIRELLTAAKSGIDPWEPIPESAVTAVARQCRAAEIAEAVVELDTLSAERAEIEPWDGDAMADVSKAQELYARVLGIVGDTFVPDIAAGFESAWPDTRHWVEIALARHGEAAFPALREALETETDAGVREFIESAIDTLAG